MTVNEYTFEDLDEKELSKKRNHDVILLAVEDDNS